MSQDRVSGVSTAASYGYEVHRKQANQFFEKGQWPESISHCRAALELNPDDWEIRLLMGDALFYADHQEEAIRLYQKIVDACPKMVLAYHRIAIALSQSGEYSEADRYYSQLFNQQPDFERQNTQDFSIQRQSGDFFFRRQEWTRAIAAYEQAITLVPEACWEHINLGRSLVKLDQLTDAVSALKEAVAIDEHNGWGYYYLADVLFRQNKWEAALQPCRRASSLMPEHLESKTLLAKINSRMSRLERTSVDSEQTSATAVVNGQSTECGVLSTTNQLNSPLETSKTIKALPGWDKNYELGKKLQVQGDLEGAAKSYYQSIIKNPYHSWSYHDLGDINLKLGNWQDAIAAYRQAIRLNPTYFWSNYNLGVAYENVGDWQSTVALYLRSAELNPGLNLPALALETTLSSWYEALMKEGDQFIRTDKDKALKLYRDAIIAFRDNLRVPAFSIARARKDVSNVLLIVDDHLSQCLRYRVQQKLEQLEHAGFTATYYSWTQVADAKEKIAFSDIIIFYRTPAFPDIIKTIKYAKAIKKIVFYEIDDLIFDSDLYPDPIESYGGQVSEDQYDGLVRGTVLFREAMRMCDLAIASTPPLLRQMEKIVGEGNCYLHRNAFDSKNVASLDLATPKLKRDYISIFYGSGTKAHNSDFEQLVAPALARILEKHKNVRLTLMGYLTIPSILEPYKAQIDRVDLVGDVLVYYEFLRQADISIAVLHPTVINDCKSELKWFEAGSFKVPSVVSNTEVYREVIEHGKDGLIAANPDEWFHCLERLIVDKSFRRGMGAAAYASVTSKYNLSTMARNIRDIISDAVSRQVTAGNIAIPSSRKKLLLVNVFYPPQSIGGATRIVKDNVDILTSQYAQEYEVSVFTSDNDNPEPYQITEYSCEGVYVTKVSTLMVEGMDWQYQNPKMYEIFKSYLEFHQPDVIHFHCVQRLTASVLEAAADLEIPYLVTAHDAWWISDHQFLVNEQGKECDYRQNDPVVAARDAKKLSESFQRKLYLRKQLNRATEVLAVSETFANIYRQNGFLQTKANRNGINPKPVPPKQPSKSGRVRLAHIGGMAAHKGYFLFKEAVEKGNLSNTEVIVINHAQSPGTVEHADWNGTPVTFLAKFKQEDINQLYSMIDVLVAPSMWPESFGLVTREAAAANVWVIASHKGAIGEDIQPGIDGDIVSVENTDNLVSVLSRIDSNHLQYQSARPHFQSKIRLTANQVDELVQVYAHIVALETSAYVSV